jgi:transcriptional regulator with XRE-family HTH domain
MSRGACSTAFKRKATDGLFGASFGHFDKIHRDAYGHLENGKVGVYLCYIDESGDFRSEWCYMSHHSGQAGDFNNLASGFYKLQNRLGNKDIFMSMNTFFGSREERHVKYLNTFHLDIDFYNILQLKGRPVEEVVEAALNHLENLGIPLPTHVVGSGQGFQMIWCIHRVNLSNHWKDARVRWKRIQQLLYEALKHFGADPNALDISRIFRVAGTINSKNGSTVRMLWELGDGYHRYDFEEMAKKVLPMSRDEHRAHVACLNAARAAKQANRNKEETSKKRRKGTTILDLHNSRISDLISLAKYRHPSGVPEGQRDWFVFFISVSLSYLNHAHSFHARMMDYVQELAPGLTEKQVRSMIHANQKRLEKAEAGDVMDGDPRYKYKTTTIIEKMCISEIEMRDAGLKTLIHNGVKQDRNRENCARWHDEQDPDRIERRQAKEEIHSEICRLAAMGMSQRNIAAAVGMSRGAVTNVMKKHAVQDPIQDAAATKAPVEELVIENSAEKVPESTEKTGKLMPRLIGRKLKKTSLMPKNQSSADILEFPIKRATTTCFEGLEYPEDVPFFDHELNQSTPIRKVAAGDCPF